jgi:hypothetical protein
MIFYLLILVGIVKPQDDNMYAFFIDGKVYEYAYREEIMEAIRTGEFKYNEDLHFSNK